MRKTLTLVLALAVTIGIGRTSEAQTAPPAADPDRELDAIQPDFTIVTLPTTRRLPRFKSAVRVTHRFGRPLDAGDFKTLVEDLFGLDSSAQIGLEYRFGVLRGTQIGIHRTNNRTIEFFGQTSLMQEGNGRPLGLGVIASVDGTNNFRDRYSPSIGVAVSRTIGGAAILYIEPLWVGDTNPLSPAFSREQDTVMVGTAARVRIRPTVYLVGEYIPRVAGHDPGVNHATFGVEKRAGAHLVQLNFSNGFGTTTGQLARGGSPSKDWYIGFNLSRKFF